MAIIGGRRQWQPKLLQNDEGAQEEEKEILNCLLRPTFRKEIIYIHFQHSGIYSVFDTKYAFGLFLSLSLYI